MTRNQAGRPGKCSNQESGYLRQEKQSIAQGVMHLKFSNSRIIVDTLVALEGENSCLERKGSTLIGMGERARIFFSTDFNLSLSGGDSSWNMGLSYWMWGDRKMLSSGTQIDPVEKRHSKTP